MSDDYAGTFDEIIGETEQEKIARINGRNGGPRPRRELKLIPFEAIRFNPTVPYVVEGMVPRNGLVTVWGPPKCGKSFTVFDMSMHVALGWPYRNHKVERGSVVYVAAEGGIGFTNRVEAWRQRYLPEKSDVIPFYLLAVPLDLIAEQIALVAAIRTQAKGMPKLVVIDVEPHARR